MHDIYKLFRQFRNFSSLERGKIHEFLGRNPVHVVHVTLIDDKFRAELITNFLFKLLISMGLKNVIMCDRKGAIYKGREGLNKEKEEMAEISNRNMEKGSLADVIKGADVFIGVSAPGTVTQEMVRTMAPNPILFPMANPTPEIMPEEAKAAVSVRSYFPGLHRRIPLR